jgi:hypothetical protein
VSDVDGYMDGDTFKPFTKTELMKRYNALRARVASLELSVNDWESAWHKKHGRVVTLEALLDRWEQIQAEPSSWAERMKLMNERRAPPPTTVEPTAHASEDGKGCERCGGTGSWPRMTRQVCPSCGGTGGAT